MGRRDGAGDGADGGPGRGAEESLRVPRLGAQPGAFGRRLVVRVQPLVRDSPGADAGWCRAAPLQVHPDETDFTAIKKKKKGKKRKKKEKKTTKNKTKHLLWDVSLE